MNSKLTIDQKIKLLNKLKEEEIDYDEYVSKLIIEDIDSKYNFEKGFYYDTSKKRLYDKYNIEVDLTKTETNLLYFLVKKRDNIVSVKDIFENCWSGGKNFSIYSIRNIIRQIRVKTYHKIIKSHSELGYSVSVKERYLLYL